MGFRNYQDEDYEAVCRFLIELKQNDKSHINWNWARLEWMIEHPEFDKSLSSFIGLWTDEGKIVGAAIYDMYFGEAFCAALPEYGHLYPEILEYAYSELQDDAGLGIAICDDNIEEIKAAEKAGFALAEQSETMMQLSLDHVLLVRLPEGFRFIELDPVTDVYEIQWLFWQGFDHGTDKEEFERTEEIIPRIRPHFNSYLSVAAESESGEKAACCCVWYDDRTDYAYIEPLCTIPSCRGKGVARAIIFEALNRARSLGAKQAYVLSDMVFYEKLGFRKDKHFSFYWKKAQTRSE